VSAFAHVAFSRTYLGSPFTAGVWRPTIIFSATTFAALSPDEREACIAHELAHVAHYDAIWLNALCLVSDGLWFVPGFRGLVERIRTWFELCADDAAVERGARREVLASALVTVAETLRQGPAHGIALLPTRSSLALRVERLLDRTGNPPPARTSHQRRLGGLFITLVVSAGVMQSVFFGNHSWLLR
jgi:beta-lactamase regulating signal transducer with metallopeptidase domain